MTTQHTPSVGSRVITDSRLAKGWISQELQASPVPSFGAFELPGRDLIPAQICNVEVTGRGLRFDVPRYSGFAAVRVQVTFPQEDAPAVVVGGWMFV